MNGSIKIKHNNIRYLQLIIPIGIAGYYLLTQMANLYGLTIIFIITSIFTYTVIKGAIEVVFTDSQFTITNLLLSQTKLFKYSDIIKVKYLSGGYMRQPGIKIFINVNERYEFDYQFEDTLLLFKFLQSKGVKTEED